MSELITLTDPEAELVILGSILIDDSYLPPIREVLAPEHFSNAETRTVYRAILALADRGVGIDAMTVFWEMQAIGGDEMKKPSILAHSASLPLTPCHARFYAERVRDLAERRRLFTEAQRIAGAALNKTKPAEQRNRREKGGIEL